MDNTAGLSACLCLIIEPDFGYLIFPKVARRKAQLMDQGVEPVHQPPETFPGLTKAVLLISASARAFPSRPEAHRAP
ncbi:hypothetical protein, partial [Steroidobacter gossypii]|uniref:hypothetical protein n=1 Tax=Steroidobacter gossypii TaxID=2805490 RepID=UPI001C3F6856